MQFHMQELMTKGLKANVRQELDTGALLGDRSDVIRSGPLHVSLEVKGYPGFITAEGTLSAELELACSRCLEPVKAHVEIPFFEQFKPASSVRSEEEDGEESGEDMVEVEGERLNLKPFVEEALLLYMPFAPLCDQDCKGLCHRCGSNLNEGTCGCKNEAVDPRFAALKDFFKE